jgi:CubicO group peptidase (beta-lactamase class C family)
VGLQCSKPGARLPVAVLQLVEQGKVRLDESIQKYVPAFPDKGSPITLKHILTHTVGWVRYSGGRPWTFNTNPPSRLSST